MPLRRARQQLRFGPQPQRAPHQQRRAALVAAARGRHRIEAQLPVQQGV